MNTMERLREEKMERDAKALLPPRPKRNRDPERIKDPVSYYSGRVSHAVRHGMPEEEVMKRRQELVAAQMEKALKHFLMMGPVPTKDQAKILCKMLMEAAA